MTLHGHDQAPCFILSNEFMIVDDFEIVNSLYLTFGLAHDLFARDLNKEAYFLSKKIHREHPIR